MRAPFELGWSLESSTNTPAFLISSLNFLIAGGSCSISAFPDSQSLLAFTIIMNHIFISPDKFDFKPALPGRQSRNLHHGPDFHGSPTSCRDPLGNPEGLV